VALGRRCDPGCESWPDDDRYKTCPLCGEETTRYRNLRPITQDEANELEFEAFYEKHCIDNDQPIDGPLGMGPEEEAEWDERYPDGTPDLPSR
jgi:hypothetical protein